VPQGCVDYDLSFTGMTYYNCLLDCYGDQLPEPHFHTLCNKIFFNKLKIVQHLNNCTGICQAATDLSHESIVDTYISSISSFNAEQLSQEIPGNSETVNLDHGVYSSQASGKLKVI
jgi:hypothetical protein